MEKGEVGRGKGEQQRQISVLGNGDQHLLRADFLPTGRCFQTFFEAKSYPYRTWGGLSQAGVQLC